MGAFLLTLAAALQAARSDVSLVEVHSDPSKYERRVVRTCGDAHAGEPILYMRGWIRGRSRGGLRLSRKPKHTGYTCVRAKVVRSREQNKAAPTTETEIIIVSHPPVLPKGWELKVIRFVQP